jgi:hypothetical protein
MHLILRRVPATIETGLWSVTSNGLTVLFQWRGGPGDLLRQLADLYEETEPVTEAEWEDTRRRLAAMARV